MVCQRAVEQRALSGSASSCSVVVLRSRGVVVARPLGSKLGDWTECAGWHQCLGSIAVTEPICDPRPDRPRPSRRPEGRLHRTALWHPPGDQLFDPVDEQPMGRRRRDAVLLPFKPVAPYSEGRSQWPAHTEHRRDKLRRNLYVCLGGD